MKPNNYLFDRRYVCDKCNTQYHLDFLFYRVIHGSGTKIWNEKVCILCMIKSAKSEKKKKHYEQQLKNQFHHTS